MTMRFTTTLVKYIYIYDFKEMAFLHTLWLIYAIYLVQVDRLVLNCLLI